MIENKLHITQQLLWVTKSFLRRPTYQELKLTLYIMQFKSIDAPTDGSIDTPIDALTDAPRDVLTDTLTVAATDTPRDALTDCGQTLSNVP